MAVGLLGLVVALGGTGWAANGMAFILGAINGATQRTVLGANYNGPALALSNTSTGASAVPLQLTAAAGHPPLTVNTITRVTNLNADYVDGLDSKTLTRVMRVNFNLASGAESAPITIPANVPVQLVGVTLGQDGGVGQASLTRNPDDHISWVGLHSFPYSSTIASGSSNAPGQTVIYIDYLHDVSVELAGPNDIRVHNVFTLPVFGSVTLMW